MVIKIDPEHWFTPSPLCSDFFWVYLAGSVAISCNQFSLIDISFSMQILISHSDCKVALTVGGWGGSAPEHAEEHYSGWRYKCELSAIGTFDHYDTHFVGS